MQIGAPQPVDRIHLSRLSLQPVVDMAALKQLLAEMAVLVVA
jgi:hypothetical protein